MMGYHVNDWGWVAMAVMMLAFWGGLTVVLVWGLRSAWGSVRHGSAVIGPDEVLAERFARGEIDEEEFLRRRNILAGSDSR